MGAVFMEAGAAIKAKEVLGQTLRDDGFFDGDRSFGHEFAEGVMFAAMDSFEERKIPYLGNLLANVAFAPSIDAATANFALRTAEGLSWLELCLLALIDRSDEFPMPNEEPRRSKSWDAHTVKGQLQRMADMGGGGLLAYRETLTEDFGLPTFDTTWSGIQFTSNGRLVKDLMELGSIPATDLRPIYNLLLAGDPAEPGTKGPQQVQGTAK
ncbi:hypothetical protein [Naasia sp. SYSU D00057]|uniref:hypothetical protein n=1 Tax=Naasia sp. SYSU D00057 TaxID=2817380 RepID=UPI001B311865|nr:hypothetical protein [Naasia sp. SYSU D00057]